MEGGTEAAEDAYFNGPHFCVFTFTLIKLNGWLRLTVQMFHSELTPHTLLA